MMNIQMQMNNEPKIRVAGLSNVTVDPVATIDDLAVVTRKFGRIVQADLPGAALKLSTATGDLIASVLGGDSREGFAEEVADVVIAAFVVAAERDLNASDLKLALRERLREQSSKAVADSVRNMLAERGLH